MLTEPNLHYTQADVDALFKRATELVAEVERLTAERARLENELEQALCERDDARRRVHFAHSGYYAACDRLPCKTWRAEAAEPTPQAVTQ